MDNFFTFSRLRAIESKLRKVRGDEKKWRHNLDKRKAERLSASEVDHIAHLARIKLTPEDRERFAVELGSILEYVSALKQIDTEGIDPTFFTVPLSNVFREDEPKPSLPVEDILANAPQRSGNYFMMPRILAGENGG